MSNPALPMGPCARGHFFARQDFFKCPPRFLLEQTNEKSDVFHSKKDFLSNNKVLLSLKIARQHFLSLIFAQLRKRLGTAVLDQP
jgi:hypothetical protein